LSITTWKNSGQREELQEERGGHHLAQQPPVFADRTDEPGDVEPAPEIR
jgi:hypothetical protein